MMGAFFVLSFFITGPGLDGWIDGWMDLMLSVCEVLVACGCMICGEMADCGLGCVGLG